MQRIVVNKHALRNALLPVVTVVGLSFGALLSGAILTETVFAWARHRQVDLRRHPVARLPHRAGRGGVCGVRFCDC